MRFDTRRPELIPGTCTVVLWSFWHLYVYNIYIYIYIYITFFGIVMERSFLVTALVLALVIF